MLKRKMNEFKKDNYRPTKDLFEIINDSDASNLRGGEACGELQSCGTFEGDCSTLNNCTTFTCTIYAW
jgi:hypothetical protein